MDIMKDNEIDCFDLKDGQICYDKKTVKKPITKKTLFDVLTKYYEGDIHEANNVKDFIIGDGCDNQLNDNTYDFECIKDNYEHTVVNFQDQILKAYKDNNLNILMASRQTGKTVTSAIFMLWFLLFHPDKTALCVADNFTTTK